jgi:hypothetical protein
MFKIAEGIMVKVDDIDFTNITDDDLGSSTIENSYISGYGSYINNVVKELYNRLKSKQEDAKQLATRLHEHIDMAHKNKEKEKMNTKDKLNGIDFTKLTDDQLGNNFIIGNNCINDGVVKELFHRLNRVKQILISQTAAGNKWFKEAFRLKTNTTPFSTKLKNWCEMEKLVGLECDETMRDYTNGFNAALDDVLEMIKNFKPE